jgi:hypothetical protein
MHNHPDEKREHKGKVILTQTPPIEVPSFRKAIPLKRACWGLGDFSTNLLPYYR